MEQAITNTNLLKNPSKVLLLQVRGLLLLNLTNFKLLLSIGGAVDQSVERALPGEEVPSSTCCAGPLPTGWVCVSIMRPAETEVMVSPLCLVCGST